MMIKKILGFSLIIFLMYISVAEAGRVRVYYQADGKVSVDHPDQRAGEKPDGMTNDEWIDAQFLDSLNSKPNLHVDWDLSKPALPFDEMDNSQLPATRVDRDRWRGSQGQGVSIDLTIILRKDLEQQIDDELAKANPNMKLVMQLQRRIDKQDHD